MAAADRLTLLRLLAEQAGVAPRLFANAQDIQILVAQENGDVAALHGWHNAVFGKDAIAMGKGDLAIALERGQAAVVDMEVEQ